MEKLNRLGRDLTAKYLEGDLDLEGHSAELSRRVSGGVAYVTLTIDGEGLSPIVDVGAGRKTG